MQYHFYHLYTLIAILPLFTYYYVCVKAKKICVKVCAWLPDGREIFYKTVLLNKQGRVCRNGIYNIQLTLSSKNSRICVVYSIFFRTLSVVDEDNICSSPAINDFRVAASRMPKYVPCDWRPVAFKLFPSGRQLYAKTACDWRPVIFKLLLSCRQSHANFICLAASRRQITDDFIHFACDWWPRGYNLHATVGRSDTICMRLAASRIQIVLEWAPVVCKNSMRLAAIRIQIVAEWLPVPCKLPLILFILHATGGHTGTICMRLAAARIQFACDWRPLGYNLNATGGQLHSNCSRVAPSCMQKQHATGS